MAGVAGNGQQALAELLCGERALDAGTLTSTAALPARRAPGCEAGVARIPEDRHAVGVVGDLPLWENAVLERYAQPPSRAGWSPPRARARMRPRWCSASTCAAPKAAGLDT
jgi:ABC-type uncharacterized transport system ATPase subunit